MTTASSRLRTISLRNTEFLSIFLPLTAPSISAMTRFTDVGRKRTYVEASLNCNEDDVSHEPTKPPDVVCEDEKPPKKKRKRGKKPKGEKEREPGVAVQNGDTESKSQEDHQDGPQQSDKPRKKSKGNSFKGMLYLFRHGST